MKDIALAERILSRCINVGDCYVWQGCRLPKGYGQIRIRPHFYQTHRAMWMAANGEIPAGMIVMHTCDNPPCCNPDHLKLGTYAENSADMVAKGRQARMQNERSGMAKLTDEQVAAMRAMRAIGVSCREIGTRFSVHPAHVSKVTRGLRRPFQEQGRIKVRA